MHLSAFRRHDWHSEADSAHAQRLRVQLEDGFAKFATSASSTVLLVILPIAHNLPLACPGIQGVLFNGGRVVLSTSPRPEDVCALIEKHRVTHIKVVPALLIRLLHDPAVTRHDLSSLKIIQSGGQSMLPEVRLLSKKLIPSAFVQENFGMSEGFTDVCAAGRSAGREPGNGRPAGVVPTTKCACWMMTIAKFSAAKWANSAAAARTRCEVISACRNTMHARLPRMDFIDPAT